MLHLQIWLNEYQPKEAQLYKCNVLCWQSERKKKVQSEAEDVTVEI